MHDLNFLCGDLRELGLESGRPLVVHSSLRPLGPVEGGAVTVIEALRRVLGAKGSLLFPNLNIPHEFTSSNPPRFDLQRDPIRTKLGILPQVFKESYATHFSRHPTHAMMGIGPLCTGLFSGHESAGLCCGPGTPWWRLGETDGLILLLGISQQSNTSIHGPEEVHADYQLSREPINGVVIDQGIELSISSRLHRWGNTSDFSRANPWLEEAGGLRRGKVGDAECLLLDARIFQQEVSARLKENPRFLLLD